MAYELARKITNRNQEIIQFNHLHDTCTSILRFIYLHRRKFDEMYVLLIYNLCPISRLANQ